MAGPSRNGKNRRLEPYSDEETGADEDVPMGGQGFTQQDGRQAGVNSVPFEAYFRTLIFPKSRFATEDDILRLCQSFHALTREIVNEVVGELRRMNPARNDSANYSGDDEGERSAPRRRLKKPKSKSAGVRRRVPEENTLSVIDFSFRTSITKYPLYSVTYEPT